MKKLQKLFLIFLSLVAIVSCQEDEKTIGELNAPKELSVTSEIIGKTAVDMFGDGSGLVDFVATADNAISYKYDFSDGTSLLSPSGILSKRFTQPGINVYTVVVTATGTGGLSSIKTLELQVRSDFTDAEAIAFLTGGTQKNWYWAASEPGHLGVGQNDADATKNYFANYYQAAPFEKAGDPASACLYQNVMTFRKDGDQLKYKLDNNGATFFNATYQSVVGGTAGSDNCYAFDTTGEKVVTLSPSESVVAANNIPNQTRGTVMNIAGGGFMSYYIGQNSYEILSVTENRLYVRAVMGNNSALAWYHVFSTSPPTQPSGVDYTNLVFSDEFNIDGAPDSTKWGYDLGTGNGWGNNESQFYTNTANNVIVQGGNLKITAKKEIFGGANYTSARLKSENKFEFKYGKVEFRAKMPSGGGTWPALWSLGENYATNQWPTCGEIDFMEHRGNSPNVIHATLHYPGNSGGNGNTNTTTIQNASTQFHVYKAIWSPASIQFFVDDVLFHSFANTASTPFNNDFFLIMNVAMGGTFGGPIDPNFNQSTMEVDYVRVYQ
jgi:beta-glucanase (GH16 family)